MSLQTVYKSRIIIFINIVKMERGGNQEIVERGYIVNMA